MSEDEIDALSVGSVIKTSSGTFRVIRRLINSKKTGKLRMATVVKKKCSQYPAAYTYLDRHYLRRNCEVTGARVKLDSALDKALEHDFYVHNHRKDLVVSCETIKDFPA